MKGEGCISVVEHLVSLCDVLGSIPSTDREVRKSQRRMSRPVLHLLFPQVED